jgi:hypothetical protein
MHTEISHSSFPLPQIFRDLLEQVEQDEMPHAINVTTEEQEAIGRVCTTLLMPLPS